MPVTMAANCWVCPVGRLALVDATVMLAAGAHPYFAATESHGPASAPQAGRIPDFPARLTIPGSGQISADTPRE